MDAAVLIPVKDFDRAKARLTGFLPAADRARLARWTAGRVVAAAAPLPVHVVCDSDAVADWARAAGAAVLWRPGHGLNGAATDGVAALAAAGYEAVVVAHSDLPLAHGLPQLAALVRPDRAVLVPDRHGDGTNVVGLPATAAFEFAYGARSFTHHRERAAAAGLDVHVVHDPALALDVDTPDDLRLLGDQLPAWARLAS